MWHLVAIILMIFLIINWPNLVYLLVDPGFLSPSPFKFLWSIAVRSPVGWTTLTDTTDEETRLSVRPSVCVLDGVWRNRTKRKTRKSRVCSAHCETRMRKIAKEFSENGKNCTAMFARISFFYEETPDYVQCAQTSSTFICVIYWIFIYCSVLIFRFLSDLI